MADKSSDPFALWRTMLGDMEKSFNGLANQAMSSPEFSKVMNQAGGASAGARKQFADFMDKYLAGMNLPSRAQMVGMAERLQNIESQLNEIRTMLQQMNAGTVVAGTDTPRPPRTKRPPAAPGAKK
jgi:division protein CdvB (Snf7/Vps24/ESCRT-III family)